MICGLPGVGKTTTARLLAPYIKGVVISSDEIRKNLFRAPTYRTHEKYFVYKSMLLVARYLYNANINCILDATFSNEKIRRQVPNELGLALKEFYIIECICPEDIVMSRLKTRKHDFSDADCSVYKKMKRIYEPIKQEHTKLDTRTFSQKEIKRVVSKMLETK